MLLSNTAIGRSSAQFLLDLHTPVLRKYLVLHSLIFFPSVPVHLRPTTMTPLQSARLPIGHIRSLSNHAICAAAVLKNVLEYDAAR